MAGVVSDHNHNINDIRIGFIGGGQMAQAFIKGLTGPGKINAKQINVFDNSRSTLDFISNQYEGINISIDNLNLVACSNIIFLCVKPNVVPIVCKQISNQITKDHLIISIAAGVTISSIMNILPPGSRVVRVMPNTPAMYGAMAASYSFGPNSKEKDHWLVQKLLSPLGVAVELDEKLIDAVTGLSGSGPAYIFLLIEALSDGGVRSGLPREVAQKLASQTVYGSAKMAIESGKSLSQLKDSVASPGGTTIAGIHELEKGKFRGTIMDAVYAASNRATELSKPITSKL